MMRHKRLDLLSPWFLAGHVLFLGVGVSYGAWRWQALEHSHVPPVPVVQPQRIAIRPLPQGLVNPQRVTHVLQRLQPDFRGRKPSINHVDHALRLWGVEATFAGETTLSGAELRELLLDHRAFAAAWGNSTKPLLIPSTQSGGVSFRTRNGAATSSHVDHTLAGLAEVGTPLDYPVLTPQGERPLAAAFQQMFQDFSLNQEEYEWSTLTFLHYLPHVREWSSTEGQRITWDRLADRLLRQRLNEGVCYGQHRLYVLAAMLLRDEEFSLLSADRRQDVIEHLRSATERLQQTQSAEGYWTGAWPGAEAEGWPRDLAGPLGPRADRLLATGHVLEWWAYAPPAAQPAPETVQRTANWLLTELEQLSDAEIRRYYPFLTHAGRALALWSGVNPSQLSQGTADRQERDPESRESSG